MSAYFVIGTDTGVGKTTVSAALLAAAKAAGRNARGIKPIETGCDPVAADATVLADAAGHEPLIYFQYRLPLAPAAAALEDSAPEPNMGHCVEHIQREIAESPEAFILIEGAGGLMVPLTQTDTIATFATTLALPVIVVGRDNLGTINHTSLTINAVADLGLDVVSFVFSGTPDTSARRATANAAAVHELTGARYGGRLPHLESPGDRAAAIRQLPIWAQLSDV